MTDADAMARYRAAHPEVRERERAYSRARGRANRELARRHPGEFLELLDAELTAEHERTQTP